MNRTWFWTAGILTGLCLAATPALPQAYTISAKPGVVNYMEGNISLNGQPVSPGELRSTALNAGDVLSVNTGKAEVLLTPGVFLRLGNDTQVRMISPSLVDTQLELQRGEAMIEVDQVVKDCRISVLNHGASILIEKEGLYRLSAGDAPRLAVIDGKAQVYLGDKKLDLGKGREVVLSELLKPEKFDRKKEDDLYAWSNIRSEYNASVSYQSARSAPVNGYSAFPSGLGYGYGGGGWLWNSGLSSWAWLPGDGAFFSPFGWGFFSPGAVAYAPVVAVPVGGVGRWQGRGSRDGTHNGPHDGDRHHRHPGGPAMASGGSPARPGASALVPVNPNRPPAMGLTSSPWANHAARAQAARQAWAAGGFRTPSGAPAQGFSRPQGGGGNHPGWSGSRPAGSPGGGGGWHGGGGGAAGYHGGGGGGGYHGGGGGGGGYHGGGGGNSGGGHSAPGGAAGGTHGR
jgi:hypothetical protein